MKTRIFYKEIITPDRTVKVKFSRFYTTRGACYYVSVAETYTSRIFRMDVYEGKWRIAKLIGLPQWLLKMENQLSDAIREVNPHELK
jgi:hypothetical protein